jgi:hypothetical protein
MHIFYRMPSLVPSRIGLCTFIPSFDNDGSVLYWHLHWYLFEALSVAHICPPAFVFPDGQQIVICLMSAIVCILYTIPTLFYDIDAKYCSKMNARYAPKYAMVARARLLRNWYEQRPANQSDLDWSVTAEVGRLFYGGWPPSDFILSFLYRSTWLLLGCVLNGTFFTFNSRSPLMGRVKFL